MRKSKAHNDEIGERLGLNDSIYFKANSLTLGVPGVHISLQIYVTIWLVAYPWAAHWHWSVIPGVWTACICSQTYTHMHWKRTKLLLSAFFLSICGTFCQVMPWGQEERSGGGSCLEGRSLQEIFLVRRDLRTKAIFVLPMVECPGHS